MSTTILERKGANYFGTEGPGFGMFEIRGNGDLALTNEGVRFYRWVPGKEFFIPFTAIKEVTIGMSHKGKTKGIPVLKIRYQLGADEFVFGVATGGDDAQWKEEIEKHLSV